MRIRNNRKLIRLILAKAQKLEEDHIILFALLLKVIENLSLRDLEEGKAPDHTTLWYRIRCGVNPQNRRVDDEEVRSKRVLLPNIRRDGIM